MTSYRHVERFDLLVWFLAVALTLLLGLRLAGLPDAQWFPLLPVLLVLGVVAVLLSRLNTSVKGGVLTVSLGPGLLPRRVPIRQIVRIERVSLPPLVGYGLRLLPGYQVYRIRQSEGLKLTLQNGTALVIASDDPDGLELALRQ